MPTEPKPSYFAVIERPVPCSDCTLPLSPVFPICPDPPIIPGMPRGPGKPCGPCGPAGPGGPGGPGGPITPAPPRTALLALTATAASLSVMQNMRYFISDVGVIASKMSVSTANPNCLGSGTHPAASSEPLQWYVGPMHHGPAEKRKMSPLQWIQHLQEPIKTNSLMDPVCQACQELHALHWAPLDQTILVVLGLQVSQGLQWDHCVRDHPLFLATRMWREEERGQSQLLMLIRFKREETERAWRIFLKPSPVLWAPVHQTNPVTTNTNTQSVSHLSPLSITAASETLGEQ